MEIPENDLNCGLESLSVQAYDLYFKNMFTTLSSLPEEEYENFYVNMAELLESYYDLTTFMYDKYWDKLDMAGQVQVLANTVSLYYIVKESTKHCNNGVEKIFEEYRPRFREFVKTIWSLVLHSY